MDPQIFSRVDEYFHAQLIESDPVLEAAVRQSETAGLPPIQVSPTQGKMLHIFARMIGAKSILEVGTLGGYSSIWLGRALPSDGKLITLELDPAHAKVATENLKRAGLAERATVILGSALDSLQGLVTGEQGPFDLVFIDADKKSIPAYYEFAIKLTHPRSLIVIDNVVRDGQVIEADTDDPDVQGVRTFLADLKSDPRVTVTAIQTVGSKGYDGFAMALVN